MTIAKYNRIKNRAFQAGKLITREPFQGPFSLEEQVKEIFEFEGYKVCFIDGFFNWMTDENGCSIDEKDCVENELENLTNEQLQQMVLDAQKILKQRDEEQAKIAIAKFEEAWKEFKKFGEIRLRVNATGEKHFHTTVDRLTIQVLPLR